MILATTCATQRTTAIPISFPGVEPNPLPLPPNRSPACPSRHVHPTAAELRAAARTGTWDPSLRSMTRRLCMASTARKRRSKPLLAAGTAVCSTLSACRRADTIIQQAAPYVVRALAGERASLVDTESCCRSSCASSLHQEPTCRAGTKRTAYTRHPAAAWP